jgi:hypothetical protein
VTNALTNVWFGISLTSLLFFPHRFLRVILWGLVLAIVLNAYWIALDVKNNGYPSSLRIGYYLWVGSFLVLAFGARLALKRRST